MDQQRPEDRAQSREELAREVDAAVRQLATAPATAHKCVGCAKRYWQSLWVEFDMTTVEGCLPETVSGQPGHTVCLTFTPGDLVKMVSKNVCGQDSHGAQVHELAAQLRIKLQEVHFWAHSDKHEAVIDLDVYPIPSPEVGPLWDLPQTTSDGDGNTTVASIRDMRTAGEMAVCSYYLPQAMANYPLHEGLDFALFGINSTTQLRRGLKYRVLWSIADTSPGAPEPVEDVVYTMVDPQHPGQLSDRNLAKLLGLPLLKSDQILASVVFGPDAVHAVVAEVEKNA